MANGARAAPQGCWRWWLSSDDCVPCAQGALFTSLGTRGVMVLWYMRRSQLSEERETPS